MGYILEVAKKTDEEMLQHLMQFYFYDFSEFMDLDVESSGFFSEYPLHVYWQEEGRYPFKISSSKGNLIGFALIRYIKERKTYTVAEFFMMKKYRHLGYGKAVALELFQKFEGDWEVFQINTNQPAQRFWRKVIAEHTKGDFIEKQFENKTFQMFKSESGDT
ncbi:GNAT family N-acetyltransferase [Alkalihalobacillus pseudalcaliphilus]|uniref:GNAT family N-acetyltransferase n=1 Tax=Alkalihalobacillus pseudalcaliphilus TaxID=79884 RepID=UPI00064E09F9|nr:GNAT family N-acetyltransferase [Alkalihalobacillus pseudalcaliphilus]KMK75144.1 hypothetical protein AB990_17005 [Alkalihalobacillus pseudalcaliphilus]